MTDKTIILCDEQGNEIDAITIPECEERREKKEEFLDEKIAIDIAKFVMEKSNIFILDENYNKYYNLLCVIADRLKSSVRYLNKNSDIPKSEEELVLFMVYACMVCDATRELIKEIDGLKKYSDDTKIYFKDICMSEPWYLSEEECLTDDEFFEHIRSLMFAHPYETGRRKIIKEKFGTQYSPWVIAESEFHKDKVGLIIYSSKTTQIQNILFEFNVLKEYIKDRYMKLSETVSVLEDELKERERELLKVKIDRTDCTVETLKSAYDVSKLRNYPICDIQTLIDFLEYELIYEENAPYITEFKSAIEKSVPRLCDAIDDGEYEETHRILNELLHSYSDNSKLDYCRSKISDAYHIRSGYTRSINMEVVAETLKLLPLSLKIDNDLNVISLYILVCALIYVAKKEADNEPI